MTKYMTAGEHPKNHVKLKIGTHLSVAKGYVALAKNSIQIGANTFQMFIRNPRGARAKEIKPWFYPLFGACALYIESLFLQSAFKGAFSFDAGGRSSTHGINAGKYV